MKRWTTDSLPDSDITVMLRLPDEEYPVWPGYHDGETWRSADGTPIGDSCAGPVIGWMNLDDAAHVMDGKKGGAK